jgi:hypothetical protein
MNQILSFGTIPYDGTISLPLDARRWTRVKNIAYTAEITTYSGNIYQRLAFVTANGDIIANADFNNNYSSAGLAYTNWQYTPYSYTGAGIPASGAIIGHIPDIWLPPGSSIEITPNLNGSICILKDIFVVADLRDTEHEFEEDILHKLHELLGRNNASPASNG